MIVSRETRPERKGSKKEFQRSVSTCASPGILQNTLSTLTIALIGDVS
jgi:hypothetical protein